MLVGDRSGVDARVLVLPTYYPGMTKVSVEIPDELLEDLNDHVGEDKKFVNQSDAIRASIRKTLDLLDEIDQRHGRLERSEE
jgi:Arc/MetJ-type ribon-helix-helix transcriptional regulator